MKKLVLILLLTSIIFILMACAPKQEIKELPKSCPASCDDGNACTEDKCSAATDYKCVHVDITPCCGNKVCEEGELKVCDADCMTEETSKITHLIANNEKLKAYKYTYETEKESFAVTIKGDIMKKSFLSLQKTNGKKYDIIWMNKSATVAYAYCEVFCDSETAFSLNYESEVVKTPIERLREVRFEDITISERTENVEGNKLSTIFTFPSAGKTVRMKVWTLYGLLLSEELLDDTGAVLSKTSYKDATNLVRSEELEFPEEIVIE